VLVFIAHPSSLLQVNMDNYAGMRHELTCFTPKIQR
jgi:hypothetical protein